MNWNTFASRLKEMVGLSDQDAAPEQILDALEALVQTNSQALSDQESLNSLATEITEIKSTLNSLVGVMETHKESIDLLVEEREEMNKRIDQVATAKIVENLRVDSFNNLNINKDKPIEPTPKTSEENNVINVDTDIMLTAKSTTLWPKL